MIDAPNPINKERRLFKGFFNILNKLNPFMHLFNAYFYIKYKNLEKCEKKRQYYQDIHDLKYQTHINLNAIISDLRYFKPGFLNRIWGKIFPDKKCIALIHYPNNLDVVRYFKMPKPFVLDINKSWYLFSPDAFRYFNGMAKLEFYANTPFAILHNVYADHYTPPTIDSKAFETVQTSKHVTDALKHEPENDLNIWLIITLVVVGLSLILGIVSMVNIGKIMKAMSIK